MFFQGEVETPQGDEEMSRQNVKCEDLNPLLLDN
jgi:hypothetical protein